MLVSNTKANNNIKKVISTMAIENMFVDKKEIKKLMDVENGKRTFDDLRKEVFKQYAR